MQIHSNFKIRYGKSTRNYRCKEKVNNSVNSGKTNFEIVEGTLKDFKKDKNWGYLTCHCFGELGEKFNISDKKNNAFKGTNIIFIDIDETLMYSSFDEYYEKIKEDFEPTLWETSFNNLRKTWKEVIEGKKTAPRFAVPAEKLNDKVAKFHLFYCFDTFIEGELYYRYCAWSLNRKIFELVGEEVDDRCNLTPSQYLNGTYKKNPNLVEYRTGISNKIYSLEDINVTEEGYILFLINRADYARFNPQTGKWGELSNKKAKKIQKELYRLTGKIYNFNKNAHRFEEFGELMKDDEIEDEIEVNYEIYSEDIQKLLKTWNYLKDNKPAWGLEPSWFAAMKNYEHIYRPNYGEWFEGMQKIEEGHFQLYWETETLRCGDGRLDFLFKNMCFRRLLKPTVTREELVVNALWDIWEFIDNSEKPITSKDIVLKVEEALLRDVEWIEETYKNELELLRGRAPKRGLQYASKKDYSKEKTFKRWDKVYIPGMSRRAFREALKGIGYWEVSDSYIEQYRAYRVENGLPLGGDEDIKFRIDTSISRRKSYQKFHDAGFKCGKDKYFKLYDEKVEEEKVAALGSQEEKPLEFGSDFLKNIKTPTQVYNKENIINDLPATMGAGFGVNNVKPTEFKPTLDPVLNSLENYNGDINAWCKANGGSPFLRN